MLGGTLAIAAVGQTEVLPAAFAFDLEEDPAPRTRHSHHSLVIDETEGLGKIVPEDEVEGRKELGRDAVAARSGLGMEANKRAVLW
jgi:hypothetical protein